MSRHGDWFLTWSGAKFWPLDPRAEDVRLADIAHALSHLCRFNGHTQQFYSVAQHSVIVAQHCPSAPLQALLHDATEAYLGDMIRPLKRMMPDYQAAEERVWLAVCEAFKLPDIMHPEIKIADNRCLMTERRDLLIQTNHPWSLEREFPPYPERIEPLRAVAARNVFMETISLYCPFVS